MREPIINAELQYSHYMMSDRCHKDTEIARKAPRYLGALSLSAVVDGCLWLGLEQGGKELELTSWPSLHTGRLPSPHLSRPMRAQ